VVVGCIRIDRWRASPVWEDIKAFNSFKSLTSKGLYAVLFSSVLDGFTTALLFASCNHKSIRLVVIVVWSFK
jgi:hypothetical protein